MGKVRWVSVLVHLFCTGLFLYQFGQILPRYVHPTLTNTEVNEVPLKDMDIPIDILVCIQPVGLNDALLKSFGYENLYFYLKGTSGHTLSGYHGWGGYDNQSIQVKSASEVLHAAKKDWAISQVLTNFYILPHPGDLTNLNVSLQRVNWIDTCYLLNLDMIENDHLKGMKTFAMYFDQSILNNHNATVELKLQGRNLAANSVIQDHLFFHTAQCVLCSVFFCAQLNKLRPILKFEFWYPIEHILVPACSSVRKIHCVTRAPLSYFIRS